MHFRRVAEWCLCLRRFCAKLRREARDDGGMRVEAAIHRMALGKSESGEGGEGAAGARDYDAREPCCECHGAGELGAESAVVLSGGLVGEKHLRGKRGAVEGDGNSVAGEGRDDGGLIADAP